MEPPEKPEKKLHELFDEGFKGLDEVLNSAEPTNSNTVQLQVRRAISALEECTRLVSAVGMFSSNEALEEVSSSNVRYLLLPALLGRLTLQIAGDSSGRLDLVLLSEAYFKDFLRRCRDYGVVEHETVASLLEDAEENGSQEDSKAVVPAAAVAGPRAPDITAMVNQRNAKIKRHQAKKEMEQKLSELKIGATREGAEDEIVREYHVTLLRSNVAQALDELGSLSMEKDMLQHMARLRRDNHATDEFGDDIPDSQRPPSRRPKQQQRPLKPVIITKDDVQKKVFGAGYPSLPVMTVSEFYEQRVKEGIFPGGCSSHDHGPQAPVGNTDPEVEEERQEERDDPELLARRRGMDEYKDDHRRGEGNRYNCS